MTSLGDACRETYTLPLIVMFINKEASTDILTRKRALQATMDSIERRYLGARYLGSYFFAGFMRWVSTVRVRMQIMRTDPTSKQINSCIEKPEFKALQYLHKLSQRILSWKRWPKKNMPFDELPNEFRDIKGDSKPDAGRTSWHCPWNTSASFGVICCAKIAFPFTAFIIEIN